MQSSQLENSLRLFDYYKVLGEKAMSQIQDEAFFWSPDSKSNSISLIVKHLHGNMLSRWTDFLTTDGEKPWRDRDHEFEETILSRAEVNQLWEEGWACVFTALNSLTIADLEKTIYIRNMGQSVEDAIMRQLAHYAYHVGQIVYLARLTNDGDWQSLSIPKGNSQAYNAEKFGKEKREVHFTQEEIKK